MPKVIQYFHSLSSPWAYLGAQRFYAIAAKHGATVVPRPIFVQQENGGIPLRSRPQPRQDYHELELNRWRQYLGIPLNLRPKYYPTVPQDSCNMVIAAKQMGLDALPLSFRLLQVLWAEEQDVKDPAVRIAAARSVGLDGEALEAKAKTDAVKAEWELNKADAIELGIFGTPTYVLGRELFWGQDRLEFLDRALARNDP